MAYLIDGHNLIPKLGLRLDAPDDEAQLIAILQEFARLSRRAVEVYFDGAPPGHARTQKFGSVTAHFIRQGSTADAAIHVRLEQAGRAGRNWVVVSSDHEVQRAAVLAHAKALSSTEFAAQLRRTKPPARAGAERDGLSSAEAEEWLKLFKGPK